MLQREQTNKQVTGKCPVLTYITYMTYIHSCVTCILHVECGHTYILPVHNVEPPINNKNNKKK